MALVGDNGGAGKSTLVKAIAGVQPADGGIMLLKGQEVSIRSPRDAGRLGIEIVYQDLALANSMVDYEPKEGSEFPFEDAVLNWSVYNHEEMGYQTGTWIADYFKEQGKDSANVIMIWGPVASEISQARGNGVLKGFEEAEGFEANVIYDGYGDFQRDLAYAEVERAVIAYPEVEVIVGLNSVMAMGLMSALETEGMLDDVLVTGMGGQPDELELVARGKIGIAVFRDPRGMGANSAEALIRDVRGETDRIERVSYTPLRNLDSVESIRQWVPKEMLDIDARLAE